MAKTKTKPDTQLYTRLRDNGVRKKIAARAADALPTKGSKSRSKAESIADDLTRAADSIRDRVGGGSRKRSNAAKKAAKTRRAKAAKRSRAAKQAAKTRS
jgi:hypothetical protein